MASYSDLYKLILSIRAKCFLKFSQDRPPIKIVYIHVYINLVPLRRVSLTHLCTRSSVQCLSQPIPLCICLFVRRFSQLVYFTPVHLFSVSVSLFHVVLVYQCCVSDSLFHFVPARLFSVSVSLFHVILVYQCRVSVSVFHLYLLVCSVFRSACFTLSLLVCSVFWSACFTLYLYISVVFQSACFTCTCSSVRCFRQPASHNSCPSLLSFRQPVSFYTCSSNQCFSKLVFHLLCTCPSCHCLYQPVKIVLSHQFCISVIRSGCLTMQSACFTLSWQSVPYFPLLLIFYNRSLIIFWDN